MSRLKKCLGLGALLLVLSTSRVQGQGLDYFRPSQDQILVEAGLSYLRLRDISQHYGLELDWDPDEKMARLDSLDLSIYPDQGQVKAQARPAEPAQVLLSQGSTYVGLDFIEEYMDLVASASYGPLLVSKASREDLSFREDYGPRENLDSYMEALEEAENFYGRVLIGQGDSIVYDKTLGYSNLQEGLVSNQADSYGIGSITKSFTAVAILQLEEKGLLSLDDPLSKYFPDYGPGKDIKLRNLLDHSSGLVGFTEMPDYLAQDQLRTQEEMFGLVAQEELAFEPGEAYSYSNTNYLLLGMIVEKVASTSWETYIEEHILSSLNMTSSGASYARDSRYPTTSPYLGYLDVAFIDDRPVLEKTYGAGSIYSTAYDMFRYYRGLRQGKILSQASLAKLINQDREIIGHRAYYGYGILTSYDDLGKLVGHSGNTFGYTSSANYMEDQDSFILILSNKGHQNLDAVLRDIRKIILGQDYELRKAKKEVPIGQEEMEKYQGSYSLDLMGEQTQVEIRLKNGRLQVELEGQEPALVYRQAPESFFYRQVDASLSFQLEADQVTGFILSQSGLNLEARKIQP